jgi:hypothetical protein
MPGRLTNLETQIVGLVRNALWLMETVLPERLAANDGRSYTNGERLGDARLQCTHKELR